MSNKAIASEKGYKDQKNFEKCRYINNLTSE